MSQQPFDELWRDMASDSSDVNSGNTNAPILSATLAEVRRHRRRRRIVRAVVAASLVALPLALAAIAWQFVPATTSQQVANHASMESRRPEVESTEVKSAGKKRPRGKLVVVEEPAPVTPEWNVVELTDEELLEALPVPAKLVDTPDGKELVFQRDEKVIPKIQPSPRKLPTRGATLLSRTK